MNKQVRISAFGFHFPGGQIPLVSLPLNEDELNRLKSLGQEYTYVSPDDSTELMVKAAKSLLEKNSITTTSIKLIISAPSLITSYSLEIPSVAVRNAIGATAAQCMNIAQGCTGLLRAVSVGAMLLESIGEAGDVLIVSSCRASTITSNMNHGSFFWGDAGGALLLTSRDVPGYSLCGYAETNSDFGWGAMRIGFGDALPKDSDPAKLTQISVNFDSKEDQFRYIRSEQQQFNDVVAQLIDQADCSEDTVQGLILPATGRNRVSTLLSKNRGLLKVLRTNFNGPHMGAVDLIIPLSLMMDCDELSDGAVVLIASPAFTAQWAGLALRWRGSPLTSTSIRR